MNVTSTRLAGGGVTRWSLRTQQMRSRRRVKRRPVVVLLEQRYIPFSRQIVFAKGIHRCDAPLRRSTQCRVGRSDHYVYQSDGGTGDEEPFTRDELKLAEAIEALEPYDRSDMLPFVSVEAMDAIQKTASGMLGMLPPSQFQVRSFFDTKIIVGSRSTFEL